MAKNNHRQEWTLAELRYLEQNYLTVSLPEMARHLKRTPVAIRSAGMKLGLRRRKPQVPWSEDEKDIVRQHYPVGTPMPVLLSLLPGRGRQSIIWMSGKLGLHRPGGWSEQECQVLRRFYPSEGTLVSERLPGRTPEAIKLKACEMGIRVIRNARQRMWTRDEIARLLLNMHLPFSELADLFPDRSKRSVSKARIRYRKKLQQLR